MEEDEASLPDNLRCNRNDGRQWRCSRRVMDGLKLCEVHHLQGRHRQFKEKVPDSLKLERKPNKPRRNQEIGAQNLEIRSKKNLEIRAKNLETGAQNLEIRAKKRDSKLMKAEKRKRSVGVSEALDETLKKMKLKKGDLQLELIREFLKRKVEKKKQKELTLERLNEKELTRELPYGLMAISGSPSPSRFGNVGACNVKLGLESSSFPRRCFRSKNIEPIPVAAMQVVPGARNLAKFKKSRRKKCHWCRKSSYRRFIKCSSCRRKFFCDDCIRQRYFDEQDVKMACPVCRGTCSCRACSTIRSKDLEHKTQTVLQDISKVGMKVDRIQQHQYLIHMLLPLLVQINRDQSIEVEMESKIKGKTHSEMQIQQAELGYTKMQCCNNCKTSIVDFHRSCANCSYNLCLNCCMELRGGSLNGIIKAFKFLYPQNGKACTSDDKLLPKMKQTSTLRQSSGDVNPNYKTLLRNWKAFSDGSISCPPMNLGGCNDTILDLRCVFPFGWMKELEVSAQERVSSYNFTETSEASTCCTLCSGTDQKPGGFKRLQAVCSNDNVLYHPTVNNLDDENLDHFRKHWGKGHPVTVQSVIQTTSDLTWDPIILFCTYLEKSKTKSRAGVEAVKATNCLDWCEVEIISKRIFMGSLEGQTHANMSHEMLKFKVWLSSHLFQEQFPSHYAEIMRVLPIQEYINPVSGLLNLAVKLPHEMPKPDLGPRIYISYGGPEEFTQADFITKLSYNSYDMVDVLAHSTDVLISTEQLARIKVLINMYKGQDQSESRTNTDQNTTSEVKGKASFQGGTEESDLQDMTGKRLHLPNGNPEVSLHSGDSHRTRPLGIGDGNQSPKNEDASEFDLETSIHCSDITQRFEDSADETLFQDDMDSSCSYGEKPENNSYGAQWDVFRREDVPKLLEYLRRHSNEFQAYCFPKNVVHPILDQIFFLDAFHKMRLKDEFNIEPWTFEQHDGEAVIIPAGCPYQVRKLKSSVNIVLEFISPENATECIKLTNELRLLPGNHKAKQKMLQVKKMALHSISTAIEEIRNLTPENDN